MHNYVQNSEPNQRERLDSSQVQNNAGGFVYGLDKWQRLARFLVLGSESPTYYQSKRKLTLENAQVVRECVRSSPADVVEVLEKHRTLPKHDTALFVLSVVVAYDASVVTCEQFNSIVRTGTHLFQFLEMTLAQRGWGRGLQRLVKGWYTCKDLGKLEYQCAKYRNRAGWTHRDVLRCCHLYARNAPEELRDLIAVLRKPDPDDTQWAENLPIFQFMDRVNAGCHNEADIVRAVHDLGLTHEMIPSERRTTAVWRALAEHMPIGALVRNLGQLTAKDVLKAGRWQENEKIVSKLADAEQVRKSRIHPIAAMLAAGVYARGEGDKGKLTWTPAPDVLAALDHTFNMAFDNVEPTGKRYMLSLDVSGSMWWAGGAIAGTGIFAGDAAAAMCMATLKVEPQCLVYGFATKFMPMDIRATSTLGDCRRALQVHSRNFGATDCALPMVHALKERIEVDVFTIYTDNETYHGRIHPVRALQEYRRKMGIDAKLVVCGMTSTGFSIADPEDPNSLDVVGFDVSAPSVIANFCSGKF
jgi:60 kDa SS-A/Ro ribonucleoprotein